MIQLCYLDDANRSYQHVYEHEAVCGRIVVGLTRGTIPLDANATRDITLVSCPDCKAKLVDEALVDPENCLECHGSGDVEYDDHVHYPCGACNGTGKKPAPRTVTGRLQSAPNLQNLPRKP